MFALALSFHETQFDVIDREGYPWLRGAQVALSLGYKNPDNAVKDLYKRNADEFTDSMTALVELETSGGKQQVRIFSLRGCHLLAMFARTKVAKEFRKWVLDILEHHTQPIETFERLPLRKTQKALPGGLTLNTQDEIKTLIDERAAALPKDRQVGAIKAMWGALNMHFGTKTLKGDSKEAGYKFIPEAARLECLSLIARLPLGENLLLTFSEEDLEAKIQERVKTLEGEVLPKPNTKEAVYLYYFAAHIMIDRQEITQYGIYRSPTPITGQADLTAVMREAGRQAAIDIDAISDRYRLEEINLLKAGHFRWCAIRSLSRIN